VRRLDSSSSSRRYACTLCLPCLLLLLMCLLLLLLCQLLLYAVHHDVHELHVCLDLRQQCTCRHWQLLNSMQYMRRYKRHLCKLLCLLLLRLQLQLMLRKAGLRHLLLCREAGWVGQRCLQDLLELQVAAVL
jgi:hypothetical protein